jgi:hypothetical protein
MRALWLVAALTIAIKAPSAVAKDTRLLSPDGRLYAIYHYSDADPRLVDSITFTDSAGRSLFRDDYGTRDYRPAKGEWTRSGRFFVYSLYSRGGHSPWHKPFVVADMQARRCTPESDIGAGDCVSEFHLAERDTISYHILDRSKDDWDAGVPSIRVRFSLSAKFTHQ